MGADEFVEQAFSEISEMEREEIRRNSRVIAALKARTDKRGEVTVGEEKIRFRITLNKKLRRKLSLYRNMKDEIAAGPVEKTEDMLYDIISSLCVDEPWTNPKTWSVYDDEAEDFGAEFVLIEMVGQIGKHAEDLKTFR